VSTVLTPPPLPEFRLTTTYDPFHDVLESARKNTLEKES
jgi:hypothetical protein